MKGKRLELQVFVRLTPEECARRPELAAVNKGYFCAEAWLVVSCPQVFEVIGDIMTHDHLLRRLS